MVSVASVVLSNFMVFLGLMLNGTFVVSCGWYLLVCFECNFLESFDWDVSEDSVCFVGVNRSCYVSGGDVWECFGDNVVLEVVDVVFIGFSFLVVMDVQVTSIIRLTVLSFAGIADII